MKAARREALAADTLGAASGEAALGFEVVEAGAHGALDSGGDLGPCWGVGTGPQDGDRLGRREGDVEAHDHVGRAALGLVALQLGAADAPFSVASLFGEQVLGAVGLDCPECLEVAAGSVQQGSGAAGDASQLTGVDADESGGFREGVGVLIPGHGARICDGLSVGSAGGALGAQQLLTAGRMLSAEQRVEVVGIDVAAEPEAGRAVSEPLTWAFEGLIGVVGDGRVP